MTMDAEVKKQFSQLLDFFHKQAANRPKTYAHAAGLISTPAFFSVAALQKHLSNPLLNPAWVFLKSKGEPVPLDNEYLYKKVHRQNLGFLDKRVINTELRNGAALVLEGIDILEPDLNEFAAQLDDGLPCSLVNCVAFFSQPGTEAYAGHIDQDDVLVVQISGEKQWHIFAPQQRRYAGIDMLSKEQMGPKIDEFVIRPGDALYLRAGVPHMCTTVGDHSLHLAFDLIDTTPNPKQISEEANTRYEYDSEDCYAPAEKAMDKFIDLLNSDEFRRDLQLATQNVKKSAKQFRRTMGRASQVDALSKYIK